MTARACDSCGNPVDPMKRWRTVGGLEGHKRCVEPASEDERLADHAMAVEKLVDALDHLARLTPRDCIAARRRRWAQP